LKTVTKLRLALATGGLFLAALSVTAIATAAPSPTATFTTGRGVTPRRASSHAKAAGPSLSVIGWGVNRLFVPKGTTVKSSNMCEEMVASDDGPIGPPQQVYMTVYARATGIPNHAPTQIKDTLPEGAQGGDIPELTPPVPFSRVFTKGTSFGAPDESTKDIFYGAILSFSAEEGEYEGPSAEEFDGTYSYTASVKVGPHTLTSTAKVTVECPLLR
jgi:hypothetical protein